jgi:hypothetical protein
MSEGSNNVPLLMALLLGVEAPAECEANLVSYFKYVITQVLENRAFIVVSGYIGAASLKIVGFPCEGKSMGPKSHEATTIAKAHL